MYYTDSKPYALEIIPKIQKNRTANRNLLVWIKCRVSQEKFYIFISMDSKYVKIFLAHPVYQSNHIQCILFIICSKRFLYSVIILIYYCKKLCWFYIFFYTTIFCKKMASSRCIQIILNFLVILHTRTNLELIHDMKVNFWF